MAEQRLKYIIEIDESSLTETLAKIAKAVSVGIGGGGGGGGGSGGGGGGGGEPDERADNVTTSFDELWKDITNLPAEVKAGLRQMSNNFAIQAREDAADLREGLKAEKDAARAEAKATVLEERVIARQFALDMQVIREDMAAAKKASLEYEKAQVQEQKEAAREEAKAAILEDRADARQFSFDMRMIAQDMAAVKKASLEYERAQIQEQKDAAKAIVESQREAYRMEIAAFKLREEDAKALADAVNEANAVQLEIGKRAGETALQDARLKAHNDAAAMEAVSKAMDEALENIGIRALGDLERADIPEIGKPEQPSSKKEEKKSDDTTNFAQRISSQLVTMAIGGADPNSLGSVVSATGTALSMINPIAGVVVSTLGKLVEGLMGMANELSMFSGELFSAMTGFELFTMGFKFALADMVGPALAEFVQAIQNVAASILPFFAAQLKLILSILTPLLDILSKILDALAPLAPLIELLASAVRLLLEVLAYVVGGLLKLFDVMVAAFAHGMASMVEKGGKNFDKWDEYTKNQVEGDTFTNAFKSTLRNIWIKPIKAAMSGGAAGDEDTDVGQTFGTNFKDETYDRLDKSVDSLVESLSKFGSAMSKASEDMLENGHKISMALFDSVMVNAQLARDKNKGEGPSPYNALPPVQKMSRDEMPNPSFHNRSTETFIRDAKIDGKSMPRPTPAAMSMHTTNQIHIDQADEDRLLMQLMQARNEAFGAIAWLNDNRLLGFMNARNRVNRGLLAKG